MLQKSLAAFLHIPFVKENITALQKGQNLHTPVRTMHSPSLPSPQHDQTAQIKSTVSIGRTQDMPCFIISLWQPFLSYSRRSQGCKQSLLANPCWPSCAPLLPQLSEPTSTAKITQSWDRGVQPPTFQGHNVIFFF